MTKCYNCEGWKVVSVAAPGCCPDCGAVDELCKCGSTEDFINATKLVPCPVCKGTGETPPKQLAFPELKTSFIRRK